MKKEDFVQKAKAVHGDKFDYSLVPDEFVALDKITIHCKIHGNYLQRPHNHLNGKKCKKCADIETSYARTKVAKDSFIERALLVHGMSYDYSKFVWHGNHKHSTFICKRHGEFTQSPSNHLAGKGCNLCATENRVKALSFTLDEFVSAARVIHQDYYDYSKVQYVNSQTKVIITCPTHGDFKQIPNSHLSGSGCPSCNKVGFSGDKPAIFYILSINPDVIKFGITSDINRRLSQLKRKSVFDIKVLHQLNFKFGINARALESEVKSLFETSVMSKQELPDGYTETTYSRNYQSILDLCLTYEDQFI